MDVNGEWQPAVLTDAGGTSIVVEACVSCVFVDAPSGDQVGWDGQLRCDRFLSVGRFSIQLDDGRCGDVDVLAARSGSHQKRQAEFKGRGPIERRETRATS